MHKLEDKVVLDLLNLTTSQIGTMDMDLHPKHFPISSGANGLSNIQTHLLTSLRI